MQIRVQDLAKKQLRCCCLLHIVNDGYIASLAVLLPFVAADLDLTYTQSGLLKTASSSAIAVAQIPAGLLSEKIGEILTLGLGLAWFSLSYTAMILTVSYVFALVLIFSSGIGGGAYHPVGTALISNVFPSEKSGPVIGTLNFFGDVGKVVFPALVGVLVIKIGWQGSFAIQGVIGLVFSLSFLFLFRQEIVLARRDLIHKKERLSQDTLRKKLAYWGIQHKSEFTAYTIIGLLDAAIRSAMMLFLGFLLIESGVQEGAVGGFLSLTFMGGALGKLLCGMPIRKLGAKRIILLTELLMVLGCCALPTIRSEWVMVLVLPLFGFMLNGTSSVIYIGLAPTLDPKRRSRGYALYFTLNFLSMAASPYLFGLVGDAYGLDTVFYVAGGVMLIGLPAVVFLKDV